ncbi:hypothetical protein HYW75_00350 [Candidatus Pacearchaeota archaeon]|nr:hypothetical protein [Candidatus Pacearchaeota archaeon]
MSQHLINYYLKKEFLLSPDIIQALNRENHEDFAKKTKERIKNNHQLITLNKDLLLLLNNTPINLEINWLEFERSRSLWEKGKDIKTYTAFLDLMDYNISPEKKEILNTLLKEIQKPVYEQLEDPEQKEESYPVIVLKSYNKPPQKREVQHFVNYYRARYNSLKKILLNRPELITATSILRILNKQNREEVTLIGIVKEKTTSKNNNIIITVEDLTESIKVVITQNNQELFNLAKDLVYDEVIGINGTTGNKVVFAKQIFIPDVPKNMPLKKSPEDIYVAVISDIHIGSRLFLEEDFLKFIQWLNGEFGSQANREIAKKVKYFNKTI